MSETDSSANSFTAVVRVSPPQQVREQLLEAIEHGVYPANTLLPSERALCDAFNVSRVSVREALAGLEALGVIHVQHGKGAFVRDQASAYATSFGTYLGVFRDEVLELLRVRQALDELAAAQAAGRPNKAARRAMKDACDAFRAAAEDPEPRYSEIAQRDEEFHVSVALVAGGKLLPRLINELNGVLKTSRRATFAYPGQIARSVGEHDAIIAAIMSDDPVAARKAAGEHIQHLCDWIESEPGPEPSAPASPKPQRRKAASPK